MRLLVYALMIPAVFSAVPSFAAPVTTACSCDPAAMSGTPDVDRADRPASCLLVSEPDGGSCRLFVDAEQRSQTHDILIETLFPGLRSYVEGGQVGSSISVEDAGWPGEQPDAETLARRAARTESIGTLIGGRVSALMGEEGAAVAEAFKATFPVAQARLDTCRALFLPDLLGVEYLELSLPPYSMMMAQGFGCHTTQTADYLTLGVELDGTLYRYMISKRWYPQ